MAPKFTTEKTQEAAPAVPQRNLKPVTILKAKYLGGHPLHERGCDGVIVKFDGTGMKVKRLKTVLELPWSDITGIAVEGPDAVQKRVTVTRLLAVGIFAFALKKSKKLGYVVVSTTSGEVICEVEAMPQELRAKLSAAIAVPS